MTFSGTGEQTFMKSDENIVKLPEYPGCFACGLDNERGLKLAFFHDTVRHTVYSDFTLDDNLRGFDRIIHGGIVSTILDETMAWTAIAVTDEIAVTSDISIRFLMPVMPGIQYRAEGSVLNHSDNVITVHCTIRDEKGKTAAEGESHFTVLRGRRAEKMRDKINIGRQNGI